MERSVYELAALGARYAFAALMLLIVLRAWRITVVDSRRAGTLRRISPETGISGELIVIEGGEKAKRGMRYPVIREGTIGVSRRADVRIRHSSVRRRHAYFQVVEGGAGLRLRAHARAPLRDSHGHPVRELLLRDGDDFRLGAVVLMLVLTEAPQPPQRAARRDRRRGEAGDEASRERRDDSPETWSDEELFNPAGGETEAAPESPADAGEDW